MKYSEFEREVEREGFNVDRESGTIYVESTTDTVMSIRTDDLFMFYCDWSAFVHLNRDVQEKLFDLTYQLAKTPLAEREEEKLYRVKFPNIKRSGLPIILTKVNWDGSGYTTMDWPCESFIAKHPEQFTFTEQEIKDIDERYLAFKVEVEDE